MIAALYVQTDGAYYGLPDVDPWDEARDARKYAGPWPVVAHPPCARWCRMAGMAEVRWGRKKGDDGGAFQAALASVRQWGGVLEHPALTDAWARYSLPIPARGGWTRELYGTGWVTEVSQSAYGHSVRKRTWLYAVTDTLPGLNWNEPRDQRREWDNLGKAERSRTPPAFRDLLLNIARGAA